MNLLDCTLRDGGYYTAWDFDDGLVDLYLQCMAALPIDAIEIGYRSRPLEGYYGKYYYCPTFVLERARGILGKSKKIAVMLNEKDCDARVIKDLIAPQADVINLVRFAVDPERISNVLPMLNELRDLGLESGVNLMYASRYRDRIGELETVARQVESANYLSLVDSYGGVYPEDVRRMTLAVKNASDIKLGFHGHNNLELAFANALAALEAGCEWLDATVTGMGRGAGNLKTELMLTHRATKDESSVDMDLLSALVDGFEHLRERHHWGTNLPYMVSGASSLPQKDVMDWVTKRYYSMNSIVRALANQRSRQADNLRLPVFQAATETENPVVLLIGGGPSVAANAIGLQHWIGRSGVTTIVHASAKNGDWFKDIPVSQIFGLVGNEGRRLEQVFGGTIGESHIALLPPYPRRMGTYLPKGVEGQSFELAAITFTDRFEDSHTALALQAALEHGVSEIWIAGYDGYQDAMGPRERELFIENESLFHLVREHGITLKSLTRTSYGNLEPHSIYGSI